MTGAKPSRRSRSTASTPVVPAAIHCAPSARPTSVSSLTSRPLRAAAPVGTTIAHTSSTRDDLRSAAAATSGAAPSAAVRSHRPNHVASPERRGDR